MAKNYSNDWKKLSPLGIFASILRSYFDFDHYSKDRSEATYYIEAGFPPNLQTGGCDDPPLERFATEDPSDTKLYAKNGRRIHNKKPHYPLKTYKTEEALNNCISFFETQGFLKKLLNPDKFIDRLIDMALYLHVSALGLLYLNSIKQDKLRIISELYLYSITQEEPIRWSERFKQILDAVDESQIINLRFGRNKSHIYRDDLLKKIISSFKDYNRIYLYGLPGNGKTQLALDIVRIYLCSQNRILWCDASSLSSLHYSYKELCRILKIEVDSDTISCYYSKLCGWLRSNGEYLIIYDNYNKSSFEEKSRPIELLIPSISNVKILFTGIGKEYIDGFKYIEVGCFSNEEAEIFLSSNTKNWFKDVKGSELCKRLNNHPLALSQASIFMNKNPLCSIDDYLELIKDSSVPLNIDKSGDYLHSRSIYASIILNIESLLKGDSTDFQVAKFLFLLSYFPESGLSGYFLNRLCFYPYRFSKNNYSLSKEIAIPYLYSDAGDIAIDRTSEELLKKIGLDLCSKTVFISLCGDLERSGLCSVIFKNKTDQAELYFGKVESIKMHRLVQESLRYYLWNSPSLKQMFSDLSIALSSFFYLTYSARKPFVYFGELFLLKDTYESLIDHLIGSKYEFSAESCVQFINALIVTSTTKQLILDFYTGDYSKRKIHYKQEEYWKLIFSLTEKYYPSNMAFRVLEFNSLFTPFCYEGDCSKLKEAFKLVRSFLRILEHDSSIDKISFEFASTRLDESIPMFLKAVKDEDYCKYKECVNDLLFALYAIRRNSYKGTEAGYSIFETYVDSAKNLIIVKKSNHNKIQDFRNGILRYITITSDRIKNSGFGIAQVFDEELESEIARIFNQKNSKLIGVKYATLKDEELSIAIGFKGSALSGEIEQLFTV